MCVEPVGSSLPKFSVNTDGLRMSSRAGGMLSLLCPAQAYPVPSTRLVQSVSGWFKNKVTLVNSEFDICTTYIFSLLTPTNQDVV